MKKLLPLFAFVTICGSAHASIVINLFAGELKDAAGVNIQSGSLLQLVNLGTDGIFNPIDLNDGSASSLTQWVSGDDSLINVPFVGGSTAAAFAMSDNSGIFSGVFEFATNAVPSGTKIGLRWFSNVLASDFATTILGAGNRYGQYTLQGVAQGSGLHGGDSWVAPSDGGNVTFDSFATASIGGSNPDVAARAAVTPVPEPTSAFLVAVGAAGLMVRRRRQS